jgi:DNA adenine methylase
MAPWISGFFPKHRIYVEPFGGGASVLLRKERSYNEVYNDLDNELVNLFRVLRSDQAGALIAQLRLTSYAREERRLALEKTDDPVERARRLIVRSHMSHGTGAARIDRPTGFRVDGSSSSTDVAGEWARLPAAITAIVERLRGVAIEQRPAIELLSAFDTSKALIYLDPPYLPCQRSKKTCRGERYHAYQHEMTEDEHRELLNRARTSSAMIVLSGYPSELYDKSLEGWSRHVKPSRAHRNAPRTEAIWLNPACREALDA